jgi:hypothetical protein
MSAEPPLRCGLGSVVASALLVVACEGSAVRGGLDEVDGGVGAPGIGGASGARVDAGEGDPSAGAAPGWPSTGGEPTRTVECASGTCESAGGLDACCAADGSCGAMYLGASGAGCVPIDGDGLMDPDCPSGEETFGCCRPNGFCGAFYTTTFGCVDPQVFPNPPEEEIPCTRVP